MEGNIYLFVTTSIGVRSWSKECVPKAIFCAWFPIVGGYIPLLPTTWFPIGQALNRSNKLICGMNLVGQNVEPKIIILIYIYFCMYPSYDKTFPFPMIF